MFGLGILKGTIIGLGIGVIASFALKEACKKSDKNKVDKSPNLEEYVTYIIKLFCKFLIFFSYHNICITSR